jgi:serpin B
VKLYRQLAQEKANNLIFSPASISAALTLAYGGARGQTAAEMARVLDLPADDELAHRAQADFLRKTRAAVKPGQRPFELALANAIWGQKQVQWRPEYLALAKQHYDAGLRTVDFQSDPEAARQEINAWVAQNTANKIAELLAPGTIHREIRLVITNAVYFKADWLEPFEKEATTPQPFFLADGRKTTKLTMHQVGQFRYREDNDSQVLELPYRGDTLAMVIILPKPGVSLKKLEDQLTKEALTKWTSGLQSQRVSVYLPKFEFRASLQLAKTLADLGMPLAFSDLADFSGMSEEVSLKIERVIHQAFVAVDEKGTEAAAATAITMKPTAAPVEERPVQFRADRPFLFLIRERQGDTILFLGRLMEP